MSAQAPDKRALEILYSTYWSPAGWRKAYRTAPEDFAYAKAAGVMFDPKFLGHDTRVETALRARSKVSKTRVSDAFLASLSSRRLDWRSALGSLAVSLNLPLHRELHNPASFCCSICGSFGAADMPEDVNILNFERFKWGGVRHTDPLYIGFDLDLFSREPHIEPTSADVRLLKETLHTAASMPRGSRLADLVKMLAKMLPSNAQERRILIGILGYCGILRDPAKPGFLEDFPAHSSRAEVPWTKNDWPYPVQWWTGSHGVSEEAVGFWFPKL